MEGRTPEGCGRWADFATPEDNLFCKFGLWRTVVWKLTSHHCRELLVKEGLISQGMIILFI
jgi:hypothetical protein